MNDTISKDRMIEVKSLIKLHNSWRRGEHDEMMNVNVLGKALDDACEIIQAMINEHGSHEV